jgi:hypothetical protein
MENIEVGKQYKINRTGSIFKVISIIDNEAIILDNNIEHIVDLDLMNNYLIKSKISTFSN